MKILKLGLAGSLGTSSTGSGIVPSDISGLDAWFKFNKDIVGADGGSSNAGDMANGEDINSWGDQSDNARNASQSTASKKPHWDTTPADLGGLRWTDDTADPSLNMASNVSIDANEDFTVMVRVKLSDFTTDMALLGSASKHLIKWTSNTRVGVFIGGNNPIAAFEETGGDVIATDTYYIHTLTRSNGATGNLKYHVHGGSFNDKSWDDSANHLDADAFIINNIGVGNDNTLPIEGVFKDVIIWKGTALTEEQRLGVFAYIDAQ